MEQTLHALGGILLKAVPTFVLVLVLYAYLTRMFFRPMEKVLKQRYEATEGARKLAEESLAKAAARTQEYEAALRSARGEIYQEMSGMRLKLQAERAAGLDHARGDAEAEILKAKAQLEHEAAQLKGSLAAESDALAKEIANTILGGRVA
jgi:F-type H+-transporting ATPase subunit b